MIASLFLLTGTLTSCGGGGDDENGDIPMLIDVLIRGVNGDGTDTSPIGGATCRLVDFSGSVIADIDGNLIQAETDGNGVFEFDKVPPDIEGFILCTPPGLSRLTLSSFTSTVGAVPGPNLFEEDVLPQTTVVANIVHEIDETGEVNNLKQLDSDLLRDTFNEPDSNVAILADGAVVLFNQMLDNQVDGIRFSNFRDSDLYGALEDLTANNFLADPVWNSSAELSFVSNNVEEAVNRLGLDLALAGSTGDLRARVTNSFGFPLRQELVVILQPDEPTLEIFTDEDASFDLDNIPAKRTGVFVLNRLAAEVRIVGGAAYDLGVLRVDANSDATGIINGQVRDSFDRVVADREVNALQNGEIVGSTVTDAQGNFTLGNVPVGPTEVTTGGINDSIETVTVLEGIPVNVELTVFVIG
jgi:hypothetical protein